MANELEHFRMLIGGKAVDAASGATFESPNPYTGRPWAVVPDGGPEDVDAAVAAARAALDGEWGAMTGFTRAALMRRLADLVAANADRLARLEVNDSGKLYREMIGQLNGLGGWYQYFAGLADKIEGRQIPSPNPGYLVYTRREPVGVVAAITPWNSPLMLMTWKLAPALAAGCTLVIKPSEHAPVSTLGFAELIEQAGFPPGVVNVVGAVWTKDVHRAHRVAARIKAGSVWINAYRVVAPSVPFGGFKQSGLGRENGIHAIDEYLEEKAIWVELTGGTRDPFTLG
jgi:aldehyde dehydrogenase (NAD+)